MMTFKQFVEGKGKKQRKLRAKLSKERQKNMAKVERPKEFNLKDKYYNILNYKDRYFFVTTHADIRRGQRGVEHIPDKDLIEMLFRSADYMYNKGSIFFDHDGNYMFYSKEYQQGFIIRVTENTRFPGRETLDFKMITWLTHGDERKPREADKRIFIENVSNEFVKYLNDVIVESNEKRIIFEDIKIPFENVIEID